MTTLDGRGTIRRATGQHPQTGRCVLTLTTNQEPAELRTTTKEEFSVILRYTDAKGYEQSRVAGRGEFALADAAFTKLVGQMTDVTVEG